MRLHGTGGTGRIFERLSLQVLDLLFSGLKLVHLAVQKFVQFRRFRVNATWNRVRAKICTDPCKLGLSQPVSRSIAAMLHDFVMHTHAPWPVICLHHMYTAEHDQRLRGMGAVGQPSRDLF